MKKSRSTLKGYFVKGAIPTEENFADLIDSMLNQDDDGIGKTSNTDPLQIKATGTNESLINFYRVGQDGDVLTWQIEQNPGYKPGLSISDDEGTSRMFIENSTGNVGIGVTQPDAKLQIEGGQDRVSLHVGHGSGNDFTMDVAMGQGLASLVAGAKINPEGTGYIFLGSRGASKITLHDGEIKFHTSDETSGTAGEDAVGLIDAKMKLDNEGNLSFGSHTRQMLNLYSTSYGIGIQAWTQYFRTNRNFGWYLGGSHSGEELDPGANGTRLMSLNSSGDLQVTGKIIQEEWINIGVGSAPPFQSNWKNYLGDHGIYYNTAGYFKDSQGIVHLKGLVQGGLTGEDATIFTLPIGYRPKSRELHATISWDQIGRVDIETDGRVIPYLGNGGRFSLDGVTFSLTADHIVKIPKPPGPLPGPGPLPRPLPGPLPGPPPTRK